MTRKTLKETHETLNEEREREGGRGRERTYLAPWDSL
jgi:hypothetical protein